MAGLLQARTGRTRSFLPFGTGEIDQMDTSTSSQTIPVLDAYRTNLTVNTVWARDDVSFILVEAIVLLRAPNRTNLNKSCADAHFHHCSSGGIRPRLRVFSYP